MSSIREDRPRRADPDGATEMPSPTENADNTKRAQRQRLTIIRAVVLLLIGLFWLLNTLDIPSIQALRTPDVLKLIGAGWCVVLGVWLLLSVLWTRAEK